MNITIAIAVRIEAAPKQTVETQGEPASETIRLPRPGIVKCGVGEEPKRVGGVK